MTQFVISNLLPKHEATSAGPFFTLSFRPILIKRLYLGNDYTSTFYAGCVRIPHFRWPLFNRTDWNAIAFTKDHFARNLTQIPRLHLT